MRAKKIIQIIMEEQQVKSDINSLNTTEEGNVMKTMRNIAVTVALVLVLITTGCGQGNNQGANGSNAVAKKAWMVSLHYDTGPNAKAYYQKTATDSDGNTVLIWRQLNNGLYNIMVSVFNSSVGKWSEGVIISSAGAGASASPMAAMDSEGRAMAVWSQVSNKKLNVFASLYNPVNNKWGSPEIIDFAESINSATPQVASDGNGGFVAVWSAYDYSKSRYTIFANRYDVESGTWEGATAIDSPYGRGAYKPHMDFNPAGVIIVAWTQLDEMIPSVYVNTFDPGTLSWGTPTIIEHSHVTGASSPVVAVNDKGDAVVAWYMKDGEYDSIYANSFDRANETWRGARLIESLDGGDSYSQAVEVDASGNAIVVWEYDNGTSYNIYASAYDFRKDNWGAEVLLNADEEGNAENPKIAMDSKGNAIAVWQHSSSNRTVKGASFKAGANAWSAPESLSDELLKDSEDHHAFLDSPESNAYEPKVYFDTKGRFIMNWRMTTPATDCILVSVLE